MKTFFTAIALLLTVSVSACDVCGCSSMGNSLGILPHYQRSFLGVRTIYQSYKNVSPLYEGKNVQDYFWQTQLWGRLALGKRFQIIGSLPYSVNYRTFNGMEVRGIGDASVLVNYNVFNNMDSTAGLQQHLMLGAGVKLATGDFRTENRFVDVPANFRLGTGSNDALFNLVYTAQYQGFGLSVNAAYRLTTENKATTYEFGNQLNITSFLFYQQRFKNWAVQPYAGVSREALAKDTHYEMEQIGTGGTAIYGLVGVECAYKRFSVGANYQAALRQNYAEGEVENRGRLMASVSFLF